MSTEQQHSSREQTPSPGQQPRIPVPQPIEAYTEQGHQHDHPSATRAATPCAPSSAESTEVCSSAEDIRLEIEPLGDS